MYLVFQRRNGDQAYTIAVLCHYGPRESPDDVNKKTDIKGTKSKVGRWWQKVVLTTGFYRLKPAGKICGWQKVAKNIINLIIKSFLILV